MSITTLVREMEGIDPQIRRVLYLMLEEIERKDKEREQQITKSDFNDLKEIVRELSHNVAELAEAQKNAEHRLDRLEKVVGELAEAQKETEHNLNKLIDEHQKTRGQVGGLSHTVGYILEDRAYKGLPPLLKKDLNIDIKSLKRDFIETGKNKYLEVNIIGEGKRDNQKVYIIGEAKTQLKKKMWILL